MIRDKKNISIKECSFEDYCKAKSLQGIKQPGDRQANSVYGLMPEERSCSIADLGREIDKNLRFFKKIETLKVNPQEEGYNYQNRRLKYVLRENGPDKIYKDESHLIHLIRNGRGVDLHFKMPNSIPNSRAEYHFWRTRDSEIFLVQLQVPFELIGQYDFERKTDDPFELLIATSVMPESEIKHQRATRNPRH